MDAKLPPIPNLENVEQQLRAAAVENDDGVMYIRASVAARIIGVGPGTQTQWIRNGKIRPHRYRVPQSRKAPRGILTAWPLDQAIACAHSYCTRRNKPWSSIEDDYLCDHLVEKSLDQIAASLGRTVHGISQRATELGVTQRDAQGLLTTGQVAALCGVSRECVQYWIFNKPLPLNYQRTPSADAAKLISETDLRAFFESNPDTFKRLSKTARGRVERYTMKPHERRKAVAA